MIKFSPVCIIRYFAQFVIIFQSPWGDELGKFYCINDSGMMQVETNISHFYQDLKIMNQLKKLDCCSGHKQLSTEPLRYAMCSLQGSYKLKWN